jgi:hypothetical protein
MLPNIVVFQLPIRNCSSFPHPIKKCRGLSQMVIQEDCKKRDSRNAGNVRSKLYVELNFPAPKISGRNKHSCSVNKLSLLQ